jgi:hypothetical protein
LQEKWIHGIFLLGRTLATISTPEKENTSTTAARLHATFPTQTEKPETHMKSNLIGATVLAAFICCVNPAKAAIFTPLTDRRVALNDPTGIMQQAEARTGRDSTIAQGNGDTGIQELAAKKAAKKKTTKKTKAS